MVVGVAGGLAAGALVRKIWALKSDEPAPRAMDANRTWSEIAMVAALEGAVYGLVKVVVDRAGAVAYERATGAWPE